MFFFKRFQFNILMSDLFSNTPPLISHSFNAAAALASYI